MKLWSEVQQHLEAQGASYPFGANACSRKWEEVNNKCGGGV